MTTRTAIAIGVCVLAVLGGFTYLSAVYYGGARIAIDWRFRLSISDVRTLSSVKIPAGIGVEGGIWADHTLDRYGLPGFAPLSTRDESGIIYIQTNTGFVTGTTTPLFFTIGDFFNIWGKIFNENCVLDYCARPGEGVVYDANGNNMVDTSDTVLVGSPAPGAVLTVDSRIRFNDTNSDGRWGPPESVVQDRNNNFRYDSNELVIKGEAPANQTFIKNDTMVKFVDSTGNGFWDSPLTAPFMSDGDQIVCVNRATKLINGREWFVGIGAPASPVSGGCGTTAQY